MRRVDRQRARVPVLRSLLEATLLGVDPRGEKGEAQRVRRTCGLARGEKARELVLHPRGRGDDQFAEVVDRRARNGFRDAPPDRRRAAECPLVPQAKGDPGPARRR
jgi:hypothetical protein